jgi:hypothetical protein
MSINEIVNIVGDRDPAIFDGDTWLMFCAAWLEWDYAWSQAKAGRSA